MGSGLGRRHQSPGRRLIVRGHRPGAIGRIVSLHAEYYHRHWDLGLFFEAKVARDLADFLGRLDDTRDGLWLALDDERIVGSIAIDARRAGEAGAHLRWFIVSPEHAGRGIGRSLLGAALAHCRTQAFAKVYLWTFAGLDDARRLYERAGFRLVHESIAEQWGKRMTEQRFELDLLPDREPAAP